jgi:hypothetical protein
MKNNSLTLKLFALVLAVSASLTPFSTLAQAKRGTVAANKTASAPKCSGAWTGTISYKRTQGMSENKTVDRVSGRGKDTRKWEMKYDYSARVSVVESPDRNGSSDGKATITHNFSSVEQIDAIEKNSCDRGKTWRDMRGSSTS